MKFTHALILFTCCLFLIVRSTYAQDTPSSSPDLPVIGIESHQPEHDDITALPASFVLPSNATLPANFDGSANSVRVVRPNGGEQIAIGDKLEFEWTSSNAGDLHIELFRGDRRLVRGIYRVSNASGVTSWTIPPYIPPGDDYYVKISSYDNTSLEDLSDKVFSILPGTGPFIEVQDADEIIWRQGRTEPITWSSTEISGNIEVQLLKGESIRDRTLTGSSGTPDDGLFEYSVPLSLERRTDYYYGVLSKNDLSVWDTSRRLAVGYPEGNVGFNAFGSFDGFKAGIAVSIEDRYAILEEDFFYHIVDIADPNNPVHVQRFTLSTTVNSNVVWENGRIHFHYGNNLLIYDMAQPESPQLLGRLETEGTIERIAIEDGVVFAAAGNKGLHVIDVKNPESPVLIKTVDSFGFVAEDVAVYGTYGIVDYGDDGVITFDFSSIDSPQPKSEIVLQANEAEALLVHEQYAYIANGRLGFSIVDISDLGAPVVLSTHLTPGHAQGLAFQEGVVYVSTGEFGVRTINVDTPEAPFESGHYRTLDDNGGVAVANRKVYTASGREGLRVLERDNLVTSGDQCTFVWPEVSGAEFVFKLIGAEDLNVGSGEVVSNAPVPLSKVECYQDDKKQIFFYSNGDLKGKILDRGYEVEGIAIYTTRNLRLGHVQFKKKQIDISQPLEALLILETDPQIKPGDDLKYYKDWQYYTTGELPMSMLIPPDQKFSSINTANKPALFVHGLVANYPNWDASYLATIAADGWDNWQFFYPFDQKIEKSGLMLGNAIPWVLGGANIGGSYNKTGLPVVSHSMGGLITRSYIQSAAFQNDITKLLMLGTPNHGSRLGQIAVDPKAADAGFRLRFINVVTELMGFFDVDAPAYIQLTPGSEFLYNLNSTEPKLLGSDILINDYLSIAGHEEFLSVIHNEVAGQDDGVVAVSSASMLQYGIPLATLDLAHTIVAQNLKSVTEAQVLGFLDEEYDARNPVLGPVTGFWLPYNDADSPLIQNYDADFADNTGMLAVRFNEIPNLDKMLYLDVRDDGRLQISRSQQSSLERYAYTQLYPVISPEPKNNSAYIAVSSNYDDEHPSMGLNLQEGSQAIGFNVEIIAPPTGSYTTPAYVFIEFLEAGQFDFKHLQTRYLNIPLSFGEQAMFVSNEALEPNVGAGKDQAVEYTLSVDDSITDISIILDGLNPALPHDFHIVDPDGLEIDPLEAIARVGFNFVENESLGYAYYHVAEPKVGTWTINFSSIQSNARIVTPIKASQSVNLGVEPVLVNVGDYFNVYFRDPFGSTCSDRTYDLKTSIYDPVSDVGRVVDIGQPDSSSSGWFVKQVQATASGEYHFNLDFSCNQADMLIHRKASTSLEVINPAFISTSVEQETDESAAGISENKLVNYPNPFSNSTTLRLELVAPHEVTLRLFDALGRQVDTILQNTIITGKTDLNYDASSLAPGTYFYVLTGKNQDNGSQIRTTRPITIIR